MMQRMESDNDFFECSTRTLLHNLYSSDEFCEKTKRLVKKHLYGVYYHGFKHGGKCNEAEHKQKGFWANLLRR